MVIQVPIGVLVVYPSALLVHFNVRIEGQSITKERVASLSDVHSPDLHLVVTPNGERPTPQNSVPVGDASDAHVGSRCSFVWFTQAPILRSSELAYVTVAATVEIEKKK